MDEITPHTAMDTTGTCCELRTRQEEGERDERNRTTEPQMTRTGKIARLPQEVRDQLNRSLQNGEPGKRLVAWLNSLPEVKIVIAREFNGRPISEQNLSEWKQGGYRDWEAADQVRSWMEQSNQLGDLADAGELSQRLAAILTFELAKLIQEMLAETSDPDKRWERLQEGIEELALLRRGETGAARHKLEQERWETKQSKEKAKAEAAATLFPLNAAVLQYGFHQLVSNARPEGQAAIIYTLERLMEKRCSREANDKTQTNRLFDPHQANSRNAQAQNPTPSK